MQMASTWSMPISTVNTIENLGGVHSVEANSPGQITQSLFEGWGIKVFCLSLPFSRL